eukprot:TRINITY_DN3790_c0_g4_i1.p1 TRINITY_DN3790_c0_g4~~TRINITY_DN3790_c0_g4_i1.p1  ORF type:complete len:543 (+),score=96.17 TRINITY_DN3790_c0_g4_i1:26-1630(+)
MSFHLILLLLIHILQVSSWFPRSTTSNQVFENFTEKTQENEITCTYYVSPDGSDDPTTSGNETDPFQTLSYALTKLNPLVKTTQYICLLSGTYDSRSDSSLKLAQNVFFLGVEEDVDIVSTTSISFSNCTSCGFQRVSFIADIAVTGSYSNLTFSECALGVVSGTTSYNKSSIVFSSCEFVGEVSVLLIGFQIINVSSCLFDCEAYAVFGISVDSDIFYFLNSFISNCSSSSSPLIIYSTNSQVINSTFTHNHGAVYGGALQIDSAGGTALLRNTSFIQNEAIQDGPAVYLSLSTQTRFENCFFSCNTLLNDEEYYAPVYTEPSENTPNIVAVNCLNDPKCPVMCGEGYYFLEKSLICQSCAPGNYSNTENATQCSVCPSGSFSNTTASTSCLECDYGYYAPNNGSTNCSICPAGSFSDVEGATQCESCPKGSYSSSVGSTECSKCSAGTYASNSGATDCDDCGTIRTSDEGSDSCPDLNVGGIVLVVLIVLGFIAGAFFLGRWYYKKKYSRSRDGYAPFGQDQNDTLREPIST